MKIEKLTENKIRVIVSSEDLKKNNLNTLLDEVIEDPALNEKGKLLKRASELAREL